jgi:hypothetical protein
MEELQTIEENFPDYYGENVSVIIALLEGILQYSNNDNDVLLARRYQYNLAFQWKYYEEDITRFFDDNGIYLLKIQHKLCPNNGLGMADKIVANDLMNYVENVRSIK